MVSEEQENMRSSPADMVEYANENSERFIPYKDVKEAILFKLPRSENMDPAKKLYDFFIGVT